MAIEPLVKISAKSETEEHGPNKILGDLTWNDPFPLKAPVTILSWLTDISHNHVLGHLAQSIYPAFSVRMQ